MEDKSIQHGNLRYFFVGTTLTGKFCQASGHCVLITNNEQSGFNQNLRGGGGRKVAKHNEI